MIWAQIVCLLFMLSGMALITCSYISPYWDKLDPDDVSSVVNYQGFWASCSGTSLATMSCAPFVKLVGVNNIVLIGRVLGGVSLFVGLVTFVFTAYIIHQNRQGQVSGRKGVHPIIVVVLIGGLGSGAAILFLASKYAYDIVSLYMKDTSHMARGGSKVARHTLGSAFFLAWFGGAMMVLGTLVFPCVQGVKKKKPVTKKDKTTTEDGNGLEFSEKYNALPTFNRGGGGVYV